MDNWYHFQHKLEAYWEAVVNIRSYKILDVSNIHVLALIYGYFKTLHIADI